MKKFFTSVLVLAMVFAMSLMVSAADATFPYEAGDDGENFLIFHTSTLEAYADDVEVTITIKKVEEKADPGYAWCVNNSADSEWQWWSGHSVAGTQTGFAGGDAVGSTDTIVITVGTLRSYAEGGDGAVLNCWNGIIPVSATVPGAAAGDATPVVAVAMVAMVACAAFVVLNKKEA